uniref:Perilipin 6 n=1 Tax=Poecilia reticulata TaxID=8081 RepID=A0A3P9PT62_POERE
LAEVVVKLVTSALLRASHLPLVRSVFRSVSSVLSGVKERYPLLGLVGGVAEVGVRGVSEEALRRATPLLQSLEPQIDLANRLALTGLDSLERSFPILNQSTEEVSSPEPAGGQEPSEPSGSNTLKSSGAGDATEIRAK